LFYNDESTRSIVERVIISTKSRKQINDGGVVKGAH